MGSEKVDGFFLIFNVAMDIWIAKLDFHVYPQQPLKLSYQNEVGKSSKIPPLCDSTLIFLLFWLEPQNYNIAKNSSQCADLVKSVNGLFLIFMEARDIWIVKLDFHMVVTSNLEHCQN